MRKIRKKCISASQGSGSNDLARLASPGYVDGFNNSGAGLQWGSIAGSHHCHLIEKSAGHKLLYRDMSSKGWSFNCICIGMEGCCCVLLNRHTLLN